MMFSPMAVDLAGLAVLALVAVSLISAGVVMLIGDIADNDFPLPRDFQPRRAVYEADQPPPPDTWVLDLPHSATPWDVPPLTRAEIQLAAILRVVDMLNVPQLRPSWVAEAMKRSEAAAGL